MASLVEEYVENEKSLIELNWKYAPLVKGIAIFSKTSILHHYIYSMITIEHRYEYRKNADLYEEPEIDNLQRLLDAYTINYLPYKKFTSPMPLKEAKSRAEDPFYQWFLSQEPAFEELWEKITDEVFYLLFGNRAFLLRFNKAVARYLQSGEVTIPRKYLDENGKIRRHYLPSWVRDAVYFRDHGRCVLCQMDLSGILSADRVDHFDHMVPLAQWGINDPCNIQLLCKGCNLKKARGEPITGNRYSPWWQT
jgi:hypothetical protein